MLRFTARNVHLDNKNPGALSWKICCSVWYWLVCNKTLAQYILLVLQPFIVLFSEIQYVSKTDKIVYYVVIVQEEKDLSEEASLKKYSVGLMYQEAKWRRWLKTVLSSLLSSVWLDRVFHKASELYQWEPKGAENAKQKHNIYYWSFIRLLLKGFSRADQRKPLTPDTEWAAIWLASIAFWWPVVALFPLLLDFHNIRYVCLNSSLSSAKPYLCAHLFLLSQAYYFGEALHMTK